MDRGVRRALPLLALFAVSALAGCTGGGEDADEDPLIGLCPQWVQGPGEQEGSLRLAGGNSTRQELGPANATHLDRRLDLYRVRIDVIDVDGSLQMIAESADGNRLAIRDYRRDDSQVVPAVNLGPDAENRDFDVLLSSLLEEGPVARTPVHLNFTLDGSSARVDYTVTFHYKVCGI